MAQYRSIQHALYVICFICHMILRCDMGSKSVKMKACKSTYIIFVISRSWIWPIYCHHTSPTVTICLSAALPHSGVYRLLLPQRRVALWANITKNKAESLQLILPIRAYHPWNGIGFLWIGLRLFSFWATRYCEMILRSKKETIPIGFCCQVYFKTP